MAHFFKTFGFGILYIICLPLILLVLAGYAVYCMLTFIYMLFRTIIVFFTGGSPFGDMKEDVEAKRILMQRKAVNEAISNSYFNMMNQPQNQTNDISENPSSIINENNNQINSSSTPMDNKIEEDNINKSTNEEENNGY